MQPSARLSQNLEVVFEDSETIRARVLKAFCFFHIHISVITT